MSFEDMQDWSAEKFEKHWLDFSELNTNSLIKLRDQFADEQSELFNYLQAVGIEHPISESSRAILVYMALAIWDFISNKKKLLIKQITEQQILAVEKGNVQLFKPLESSESFQMSLMNTLESYPAKEIFLYVGQSISSRDLGREDTSITADQRGWMILYLKVVLDTFLLSMKND